MPQYRVRPGYRHGIGKKYGSGDMVMLTESEAAGFLDKLERMEEISSVPTLPTVDEREEVASETPVMHFWNEPENAELMSTLAQVAKAKNEAIGAPDMQEAFARLEQGIKNAQPMPDAPLSSPANFSDVVGIGAIIQAALYEAGYLTWEDVLQAGVLTLRDTVPSLSPSRARALFTRAQREAQ